ncbi:MAG: FKBP-type peptidyl-prolyl cis-trans isomerase [Candidatus Aenigmatarchaeota archaeon]
MPIEKGSFILLDYTARIKETNEVFETTIEEEAKKAGLYNPSIIYEPRLIIIGDGWILKSVEEKLIGLEEASEINIEIPPENAFGPRDPNKIKIIPLRRFRSSEVTPTIGARVSIDGKEGVIRSISSGRVQVDFNPPLAGKSLIYECKIRKIIIDPIEKIKYLLHDRMKEVEVDKFSVEILEKEVRIKMPKESFLLPTLQIAKKLTSKIIYTHMPEIEKVSFIEEYLKSESET